MLEFRILGPLEVRDGDRRIHVGGRNRRALLAVLLLHTNELVSTERLLDDLYGERPPKTATQSLHNAVSQLRRVLGRDVVETYPAGYVLRLDADALDLARFESLVARARGSTGAERAQLLGEALALWRGDPLADLADEPFAQTEILRLEEARLTAMEERIDADLALGRHAALVGELEALVARNPLRERLRRQLMLALYGSGRQADALAAYQGARRTLVDELGLEPSEELQELERAILRQDPALRPAPSKPIAPAPAGRRKTVTVLFCDLVESTALGEQLDPEVLHGVLSRYFEAMLAVLERHGGTVEKFIGDAIAAVFGVPVVHEDDALRAVRAAVEMRRALETLNEGLERELGLRLRAHTGVNTGEAFTGASVTGSLAAGDPTNVAARLQEAARAGEIVIGEATFQLVRDAVVAEPLEPLAVKGKKDAQKAYRVLGVETGKLGRARRFDTPMVGRARELDALRDAFEAAVAERAPRLFTVLGAAGVGKSRLVLEFQLRVGAEARVLRGGCLPYGEGISLWPLIEAVRRAADVTEDTPRDEARRRVKALVAGEDGERLIAARLSQLLGVGEGTASSDELAWAVRRLFEALARRRPLVLVFDDVHWGEAVFLDFVELVARSSAEVPILVVCLARPELLDARPEWGAGGTGVRVTPLDDAESAELVENLLGAGLEDAALGRIRAAAEGNPLYVEELVAMLVDEGLLRREDGRWTPTDDLTTLAIPPTIGALLAARLERLPDDERRALEVASIEGQVFHAGGVNELLEEPERPGVSRALTGLVHKDLVRPARASFAGDEAFRFRHLLIRDAAYAALPKRRRADLHERFASWVDERSADRLSEQDAIVGYHLEQAYRYGAELGRLNEQLARSAGERLASAGIRASKRSDNSSTVNLLRRASDLLPDRWPTRADVLCELGLALRRAGELDDAASAFAGAIAAAEAAGDEHTTLRARIERTYAGLFTDPEGRAAQVMELVERAIPVFQESGNARALGRAWGALGFVHAFRGDNAAWEKAEERSWIYLRAAGWAANPGDIIAAGLQGPRAVREVVARCAELLDQAGGDPGAEANLLAFQAGLEAMLGHFEQARRSVARSRGIYEELGDRLHVASACASVSGQIERLAGDLDAAEHAWREGCAILEQIGDVSFLASHNAELADVLYMQRRYAEADEWSRLAEERGAADDIYTQVLWRIARSKVLAQQGDPPRGKALAREAVELASATDALVVIGRAHLALAEVLRIDGRFEDGLAAARAALELFKRKGDLVSARSTRALIARIESEGAELAGVAKT